MTPLQATARFQAARPRDLALLLLLLIGAACWFGLARDRARDGAFEIDEAEWVAMGVHAYQLAATGELVDRGATPQELTEAALRPWRLGIAESTFGWMYPVVPKLLFGAASASGGLEQTTRTVYPRFRPADPGASRRARDAARALLAPGLAPSRGVTTGAAAVLAVLLFLVARRVAGPLAGAAAYALWLASPTVRLAATYVRTDLFPLLFAVAALWLAVVGWRALQGSRGWAPQVFVALALGIACGLAVGSKLNGALVSFAVPLWLLVQWRMLGPQRPPWTRPLASLAVTAFTCAIVFWLCMPGLWGESPLPAVRELLASWRGSLAHQVRVGPADLATPSAPAARMALAVQRVLWGNEPLFELSGLAAGLVLLPLGLLGLGLAVFRGPARRRSAAAALALLLAVLALGTALWVPHDRPRFFHPLLLVAVLLEAVAIGTVGSRLRASLVPQRPAASRTSPSEARPTH